MQFAEFSYVQYSCSYALLLQLKGKVALTIGGALKFVDNRGNCILKPGRSQ